jgi:CIC family chloride channel protein
VDFWLHFAQYHRPSYLACMIFSSLLPFFRSLLWQLRKRMSERQFLLLTSIAVGFLAGGASITLKTFVFFVQEYLAGLRIQEKWSLGLVFLPMSGMLITVFLIRTFWPDSFNKGISAIVDSVRNKDGKLPFSQTYNHIFTSGITVGFGGSAGVEAPIVATGAALGSNVADFVQLRIQDRNLMLACGIAAGIAASFNAPIAGMLFAAEVFLVDISLASIVPVMLAAATGALLSKVILSESILLHFTWQEAFRYENLVFYIFLGLLTGFTSIWFSLSFKKISAWLQKIHSPYYRAVLAGSLLAVLLLFFPGFYGEGYDTVKSLASFHLYKLFDGSLLGNVDERGSWIFILALLVSAFLKAVATSVTIGGGGNGGQFAPSLFIGANLGYAFSKACKMLGFLSVSTSNFTIVGMAGIISGFFFAPMSAIFLIAELTQGYELMIPLMIVSALSYSVAVRFGPGRVNKERNSPARSSEDRQLLEKLHIHRLMESDYDTLRPNMTIAEFIPVLERSAHNTFPVIGSDGELLGILAFSQAKDWIFRSEYAGIITMGKLMKPPKALIHMESDGPASILDKFEQTKAFRLPVIDENKRYLGFITKGAILSEYRKEWLSQ